MTDQSPAQHRAVDKRIDYKVWAATAVAALWAAADVITAAVQDNPALSDGLPAWLKWLLPVLIFAAAWAKKSQRVGS